MVMLSGYVKLVSAIKNHTDITQCLQMQSLFAMLSRIKSMFNLSFINNLIHDLIVPTAVKTIIQLKIKEL